MKDVIRFVKGKTELKKGLYEGSTGALYRVIDNRLYRGVCKVKDLEPELEEQLFEIKLPIIPLAVMKPILSFFRFVYSEESDEAVALLWYNFKKREWGIEIPKQSSASSASVHYEREEKDILSFERKGFILVGSVHSHCNMSAFHSGTDDDDESCFDGIHITIGKITSIPEYDCRFIMKKNLFPIEPEKCMELELIKENFPEDWKEKIKKPEPVLTKSLNVESPKEERKIINQLNSWLD